ncbi:MAG: hypothetical protein AB8I08_37775 [Sandaracinaceae bacterium]
MRLWLLTALMVMGACSGEERAAETPATMGDERAEPAPPPELAPAPAPSEPLPTLDEDTACGQALLCCRAFAEAVPHVVESSACVGPFEAAEAEDADAQCALMQAGWREALFHATGEPPASCGASERPEGR